MARRLLLAALVALAIASPSIAQTGATGAGEQDPVFVFNRICYAQVPDVQAIRKMALELAWKAMEPEDVAAFVPAGSEPAVRDGWDAQVGERIYRVAVTQGAPAPAMATAFPGFEDGTATRCTMVLDEHHAPDVFLANMRTLAGKEPLSANVPGDGGVTTTTWAGGNEDLKVVLVAQANPDGAGGVLSVTVLQR